MSEPSPERKERQETDRRFMHLALQAAREAALAGEVPVGAVIAAPGQPPLIEKNRTRELSDPTAHAEVLALRRAAERLGDWRLLDHTLYVTLEPCAMCAGAIVLARVPRLVYGASDPKAGMCGSLGNLVADARLNHEAAVEAGLMADECGTILRDFFRSRRTRPGESGGF